MSSASRTPALARAVPLATFTVDRITGPSCSSSAGLPARRGGGPRLADYAERRPEVNHYPAFPGAYEVCGCWRPSATRNERTVRPLWTSRRRMRALEPATEAQALRTLQSPAPRNGGSPIAKARTGSWLGFGPGLDHSVRPRSRPAHGTLAGPEGRVAEHLAHPDGGRAEGGRVGGKAGGSAAATDPYGPRAAVD